MWTGKNLFLLFVIFSLIHQNFSSLLFIPEYWSAGDYYAETRASSTHRGLLFSYSSAQKQQLCADIFSAQLYLIPETKMNESPSSESEKNLELAVQTSIIDHYITDGLYSREFGLTVGTLGLSGKIQGIFEHDDLFFVCVGRNFVEREFERLFYFHVSSGFRTGWWNGNKRGENPLFEDLLMATYINASPVHVPLKQEELEQQYLNTRQIMDTLAKESPEYFRLIESKEILSLPRLQQRYVCASILSSPIYRIDRLEYSLGWVRNNYNPAVVPISLALKVAKNNESFGQLKFPGITCKGYENADNLNSPSTNLYLTPTYDNKDSVYVVKEEEGGSFLNKYFTTVPVLINFPEFLQRIHIAKNYSIKPPTPRHSEVNRDAI